MSTCTMATRTRTKNYEALAIAKDVLKHLNSIGSIVPGSYIAGSLSTGAYRGDEDASRYIDDISKNCKVCALGACFLSYIRKYDNVELADMCPALRPAPGVPAHTKYVNTQIDVYMYLDNFLNQLEEVFSHEQLALIESAFEGRSMKPNYPDCDIDYGEIISAIDFGKRFKYSRPRLKAIMENMLANGGNFTP